MRDFGELEHRRPSGAGPAGDASPRWRASVLATSILPLLSAGLTGSLGAESQPPTLIRDAVLIDGIAGEPASGTDILIEDGRIAKIGRTGSLKARTGTVVVEAAGKTVMPGIINVRGLAGLVRSPERPQNHFLRSETLAKLGAFAAYGVTTTATLAPEAAVPRRIQQDVESGRVRSVARPVTPVRALAMAVPNAARLPALRPAFEIVGSAGAGRRAVDSLQAEGAEYIELWDTSDHIESGGVASVSAAIVERASHHGLQVVVVASNEAAASQLVQAGARVVASSISDAVVSDSFISLLLVSDAVYAPALSAESAAFEYGGEAPWLDDRYLRRFLVPGIVGLLRGPVRMRQALDPDRALRLRRFDIARRNLRRIEAAGVKIGLASASGFPGTFEGFSDYREAVLMKRAGMSAMSVVRAFSTGSATALGIEEGRGSLESGHLADLVILNGNPLENIHNLRELHGVFIGGQLVKL